MRAGKGRHRRGWDLCWGVGAIDQRVPFHRSARVLLGDVSVFSRSPTAQHARWAAQQALAALSSSLACGAIVNAAGDIASFGALGDGQPFRIGIADPTEPRRLAEIVELRGAIATSGSCERGSHLIDPHSGRPATDVVSASVTGPDLGLADTLATALAVAGEADLAFIEPLDGYEALVIKPDGDRRATKRFPFARANPARDLWRRWSRSCRSGVSAIQTGNLRCE